MLKVFERHARPLLVGLFVAFSSISYAGEAPEVNARGDLSLSRAYWLAADTIAWSAENAGRAVEVRLHFDPWGDLSATRRGVVGGQSIVLRPDPAGLPAALRQLFPHLATLATYRLAPEDVGLAPEILRSRVAISARDRFGRLLDATGLQIPGVLDDLYRYEGPLGATFIEGTPQLAVWAPTARNVELEIYTDAQATTPQETLPMIWDPQTGVWSITGRPQWRGAYYQYAVEVYAPSTQRVERNRVTDPYSLSLATNSRLSQIVDLNDPALMPAGWTAHPVPRLDAPEDISLYELHVRDFSIADASVPEPLRGTYGAFAIPNSAGMQHLRALADAGLTHIHLLPVFDIATVNENRAEQREPEGDLASFPPDSEEQQARISVIRDQDGFNWGYDPWHYTVPEGSYAVAPEGGSRVVEFREMVQALHEAGLRVVMDVVYNHTNASGQSPKSVLDRIVPGYYHRLNADGAVERSTCCENTASEHAMMEKLMVDSLVTWAKDYKVDGFRFDLMGHHMKRNMLKVRDTLKALSPEIDGVDGNKIYLYGEGWNFGEVANNQRGINATQLNMGDTGIGTFTDRLRDAARGGNPFGGLEEQGFLNGLFTDPNDTFQGDTRERLLLFSDQIRVGLAGNLARYTFEDRFGNTTTGAEVEYNGSPAGYAEDPQETITYVSAHDNETLFDAIQFKAPRSTSMAERVRMQNLGLSVVALSQSVPFFHAGSDMLRSKSLDRNSFNSGDWFNEIDFTYQITNWGRGLPLAEDNRFNWPLMRPLLADPALEPTPDAINRNVLHLREMLRVRMSSPLFRLRTGSAIREQVVFRNTGPSQIPGLIAMDISDAAGNTSIATARALVIFNADVNANNLEHTSFCDAPWELHPILANSYDAEVRRARFDASTCSFSIPGRTAAVFWVKRAAADQTSLLRQAVRTWTDSGEVRRLAGAALRVKLRGIQWLLERNRTRPAQRLLRGLEHRLTRFADTGWLTPKRAEDLGKALSNIRVAAENCAPSAG